MSDDTEPDRHSPPGAQPEDDSSFQVPTLRWAVPAVLVVAVVALVAVALLRGPSSFDPTTPEGAVQDYLLAISDQRWEDAFAVLDPDSFPGCEPEDIRAGHIEPFTATHDGTRIQAGRAMVDVRLRFSDQGGIGGGWESWEQFTLVERDSFWYITGEPWPYFHWNCVRA